MTMKKIRCFDIEWDTDGETLEDCGLPTECIIEVEDDLDVVENGCDKLSDKYGFLLYGFKFEEIGQAV